jgi:hypothetical protein
MEWSSLLVEGSKSSGILAKRVLAGGKSSGDGNRYCGPKLFSGEPGLRVFITG